MTVIQNGRDAFQTAFSQYTDTVYRVAVHNTRNEADAQDITQEVFLRLLECKKMFRDNEHMKAWLIRVTINLCRNHLRNRRRETLVPDAPPMAEPAQTHPVLDAVRALPEDQRNAVYLHYYEGYTAREIAAILGSTTNTVLSRLHRARQTLRETIGGIDDETI